MTFTHTHVGVQRAGGGALLLPPPPPLIARASAAAAVLPPAPAPRRGARWRWSSAIGAGASSRKLDDEAPLRALLLPLLLLLRPRRPAAAVATAPDRTASALMDAAERMATKTAGRGSAAARSGGHCDDRSQRACIGAAKP